MNQPSPWLYTGYIIIFSTNKILQILKIVFKRSHILKVIFVVFGDLTTFIDHHALTADFQDSFHTIKILTLS